MFKLFIEAWKGEASLAKAFWLIYVLYGIILAIIITVAFAAFVPDFLTNTAMQVYYGPLIRTIYFPYSVYAAVCVWRCGIKSSLIWKILSRIAVILSIALGILQIIQLIMR